MYRIMIVDDEENILNALRRLFVKDTDWEIEAYNNAADALKRATTCPFDLFLSDFRMPEINGVEFLTQVKELQPDSMRFILSGFTDLDALLGAINEANIFRFINKPWHDGELISSIQQALEIRDVIMENRFLANEVREQRKELERRKKALNSFRDNHPDLFKVAWGDDGSIIINAKDYEEE